MFSDVSGPSLPTVSWSNYCASLQKAFKFGHVAVKIVFNFFVNWQPAKSTDQNFYWFWQMFVYRQQCVHSRLPNYLADSKDRQLFKGNWKKTWAISFHVLKVRHYKNQNCFNTNFNLTCYLQEKHKWEIVLALQD